MVVVRHNECDDCLYRQKGKRHGHCPILKMSVNRASTTFGFASWVIKVLICGTNSDTMFWWPDQAKQCVTSSLPHHGNECQRSINDIWSFKYGNI